MVNKFHYNWSTNGFVATIKGTSTSGSQGTLPAGVEAANVYPAHRVQFSTGLAFLNIQIHLPAATVPGDTDSLRTPGR